MYFIKNKYIIISILVMVLISYGHLISSNPLIVFGLFIFLTLIIIAEDVYKVSILFLFVPFNGILKINLEGNTLFSLGVLICTMLLLFKKYKFRNINLLIILFLYTLIVKLFIHDIITLRYFFTFVFLILISLLSLNSSNKKLVDLKLYARFFVIGTIVSNFLASLITKLPKFYVLTKGADVQLEESWGIFRFAGFNGDPNRNALQIAFAIGCLLVLIEQSNRNKIMSYLGVFILAYYGFLSVSKMYYLILGLIIVFYVLYVFINYNKTYQRFFFFIIFLVSFIIAINTEFVQEQIEILMLRNERTGSNDLTTGRSSIQLEYLNYLLDNISTLFFGRGFLTNFIPTKNVAHNSIIQGFFGLGLFGFILFLKIILPMLWTKNNFFLFSKKNLLLYSIPLVVLLIGIMSLDLLNMDAFYFYLILLLVFKKYIFQKNATLLS